MNIVLFKVNQLGDNLVFLPVVQALRAQYPQWNLFLWTSPTAAPLYEKDIAADRLLVLPTNVFNNAWKRPWKFAELLYRLRAERADASVLTEDQGNVAHMLALLAGGKVRAGVTPRFIKIKGAVNVPATVVSREHIAVLNWEIVGTLVRALGGAEWAASPPPPDLGHLTGDSVPVAGRIVIHPGASRQYQRWFPERYAEVANRLAREFEVLWLEQEETRSIQLDGSVKRVQPKSLKEFIPVLRSASMLVANNSGPMHLASALGCPSVIINGPSHPSWDPYWYPERFLMLRDTSVPCLPCDGFLAAREACSNLKNPMACMKSWSVDAIHEHCRSWMAKWAPGQSIGTGNREQIGIGG